MSATPVALRRPVVPVASRRTPPNPPHPRSRIALVNPPDPTSADGSRLTVPLGLGYLASEARARGHHVDVHDLAVDVDPTPADLAAAGLLGGYDVVGLTTYTETFLATMAIVDAVLAAAPATRIVLGGYHASIMWREVLRDFPQVDAVVRNEGELPFGSLVDAWADGVDRPDVPGVAYGPGDACAGPDDVLDQDGLLHPVVDVLASSPYLRFTQPRTGRSVRTVAVVSSRGCPKRCSFCSIVVMSPRWRARSVPSLMGELRERYEDEPFGHVVFQDANLFVRSRRTVELAEAIHALDPSITWSGTATADHVVRHADVLPRLAALGCAFLEIGIEAGNDASLERFNKWTTVEMNEQALALLAGQRIAVGLDFIMFEPQMTLADLEANWRFLQRTDLVGTFPADCVFSDLRLYPGTPARDAYEARHGVRLPPHRLVPIAYDDPTVAGVRRVVHEYLGRHEHTSRRLVRRALAWAESPDAVTGDEAAARQRASVLAVRLRHLPYRLLDAALGHAGPLAEGATLDDLGPALGVPAHLELQAAAEEALRDAP